MATTEQDKLPASGGGVGPEAAREPTAAPEAAGAAGAEEDAPHDPGTAESFEPSTVKVYDSFDTMDLKRQLLHGIYSYGFEQPSAIQQRAIVPFASGGDLIAQAQSGTGKTGAFVIGMLQRMDPDEKACQGLILSPTRELANQTKEVVTEIGKHLFQGQSNFVHIFVGGTAVSADERVARAGVTVAVGTPGRCLDVIQRRALNLSKLKVIVLDEADEMMSEGFKEQIFRIFSHLPKSVQVSLFSATMDEAVREVCLKFMVDPVKIFVKQEQVTLEGIKQFYVNVEEMYKLGVLADLYSVVSVSQGVIFCNSKRKVDWVAEELRKLQHQVSAIHGDMSRQDRDKVMAEFRARRSRVLITTDLLARGIDVHHVSIVFNFDFPTEVETYLHRIGRSGRYGRKGIAISLVPLAEMAAVQNVQGYFKTKIEMLPEDFKKFLS